MRKINKIALCLSALVLCSCGKASREDMYNKQESQIESFINSLLAKDSELRVEHIKGSNRVVLVEGQGEVAGPNADLALYYAGYVFTGNISNGSLFTTNMADIAEAAGWTLSQEESVPLIVNPDKDELVSGLKNGLSAVREGEEAYIVFSGKYGFGKKAFGTIPANAALLYHIRVESVGNN